MADFLVYYIWIIINLLEITLLKKCIYDHGDKVTLQVYLYLLWGICLFIPLVNLILGIIVFVYWIMEGYTLECNLINKLKNSKFIKFLNKRV